MCTGAKDQAMLPKHPAQCGPQVVLGEESSTAVGSGALRLAKMRLKCHALTKRQCRWVWDRPYFDARQMARCHNTSQTYVGAPLPQARLPIGPFAALRRHVVHTSRRPCSRPVSSERRPESDPLAHHARSRGTGRQREHFFKHPRGALHESCNVSSAEMRPSCFWVFSVGGALGGGTLSSCASTRACSMFVKAIASPAIQLRGRLNPRDHNRVAMLESAERRTRDS